MVLVGGEGFLVADDSPFGQCALAGIQAFRIRLAPGFEAAFSGLGIA